MATDAQWLRNHRVAELWSSPNGDAVAFTLVPQWSVFRQNNPQEGDRIPVHYFGNKTSEEGDIWVDAADVGPVDEPTDTSEPDWPDASPPPAGGTDAQPAEAYQPPTAPGIPDDQRALIAAVAGLAEIDPSLLAATAARESGFKTDAYRREPGLDYVQWRTAPDQAPEKFFDGSIGACQVLRSNFRAFGIDNEQQAYDAATNYRIGALIIRGNVAAFPGDLATAISAYNVGQQGARNGNVPANDYTETILKWLDEYKPLFGGNASPQAPAGPADDLADQMIAYGKSLANTPYVFGGKFIARDGGIDCSGFVCEVLEHCGVRLGDREYLSAEAIRQRATPISEDEVKPADLVFFQNTYPTPGASHIGFWIGPGQMLDAHQPGGVQVTQIHTPYWQQHWLELRRVVPRA